MTTDSLTAESLAAHLLTEAEADPEVRRLLGMLDESTHWTIQEVLDSIAPQALELLIQAVHSLDEQNVTVEELVAILRGRDPSNRLSPAERDALTGLVRAFRQANTFE